MASLIESASVKAEIGVSAMRFKYEEFNNTGAILDKEQGNIPGLTFKLAIRRYAWEWEGSGTYQRGQVAYAGQTIDAIPLPYNTRTVETIGDVSLRLGNWIGERYPFMPFAGVGYRRWDRDILAGSIGTLQVNGLFESYRWRYIWMGTKFLALPQSATPLMLDVGLLKPIRPELLVDSNSNVLHLESKIGVRMLLTSSVPLSANTKLTLEPYYEYWGLGRSPAVPSGTVPIYEPDSKTHNIGLNLRLGWTL